MGQRPFVGRRIHRSCGFMPLVISETVFISLPPIIGGLHMQTCSPMIHADNFSEGGVHSRVHRQMTKKKGRSCFAEPASLFLAKQIASPVSPTISLLHACNSLHNIGVNIWVRLAYAFQCAVAHTLGNLRCRSMNCVSVRLFSQTPEVRYDYPAVGLVLDFRFHLSCLAPFGVETARDAPLLQARVCVCFSNGVFDYLLGILGLPVKHIGSIQRGFFSECFIFRHFLLRYRM